ncbi:TetR/AcrR family transcriptional regulator [Leucothrix mucor]|uniref:TetR/AcrR family transcriptional regulator n=1 Tax=Leucothrix mucor TaxID=45248 RepID=UPI0003B72303|nr:TetR family transcriptional regulator C-terminal domain-containing protein [Leucothrix mucor]
MGQAPEQTRRFSRESADHRKEELILATLRLIAVKGVRAATVRAIALEASVTQGLIRHYFSSKDELIIAAYEYHMQRMTELSAKSAEADSTSALERLASMVVTSLSPPVVDPQGISLWAGFFQFVQQHPQMRATHERTYLQYRDRMQALIADALSELGRPVDDAQLRQYAIACNAVIDGLWLEGGALAEMFAEGELAEIGLKSVSGILGMDLTKQLETL